MTDTEQKAVRRLISACERMVTTLDRFAANAESGKPSYKNATDAENYRVMSADLRKAIKKASAVLR